MKAVLKYSEKMVSVNFLQGKKTPATDSQKQHSDCSSCNKHYVRAKHMLKNR